MRNNCILVEVFVASIFLIPFWTVAIKKTSNIDEFSMKNQRARLKEKYVVQEASDNFDDNYGIASYRDNSDELPALIVDYANMIRNDIVLLDNSVETRSRKRGNARMENYNNQQSTCTCEKEGADVILFGEDYFPSYIETIKCNSSLCTPPYRCHRRVYNITVLKRKKYDGETSAEELPDDLRRRWVAEKKPISVACLCSADYVERY